MDKLNYKKEVQMKMNDIEALVKAMQSLPVEKEREQELKKVLQELENIKSRINLSFNAYEITNEIPWDEFEKNIYKDFSAYDNAYRKAGSIFKSSVN